MPPQGLSNGNGVGLNLVYSAHEIGLLIIAKRSVAPEGGWQVGWLVDDRDKYGMKIFADNEQNENRQSKRIVL